MGVFFEKGLQFSKIFRIFAVRKRKKSLEVNKKLNNKNLTHYGKIQNFCL